jgi:hypothetical protein
MAKKMFSTIIADGNSSSTCFAVDNTLETTLENKGFPPNKI